MKFFIKATTKLTELFGHPFVVTAAGLSVITWAVGALFVKGHFANTTYELYINSATTCVTFVMVFIIQSTQNRETRALNTKLDAIMSALDDISDEYIGIEELPEKSLKQLQERLRSPERVKRAPQTEEN